MFIGVMYCDCNHYTIITIYSVEGCLFVIEIKLRSNISILCSTILYQSITVINAGIHESGLTVQYNIM